MVINLKMRVPKFVKSGLAALMKMDASDRCMSVTMVILVGIGASMILWQQPLVMLILATIVGSILFIGNVLIPSLASRLGESNETT